MQTMLEMVEQTHRAILFEQFTHSADNTATNLFDLLSDTTSTDEELYKAIEKKLEVHSFKEFLEKFQPRVFRYTTGTANGVPTFQYTTDPIAAKKFDEVEEIEITSHAYYQMLVNMYSQKGDSGVANIEFNDEKIREILTPKREIENLYDTRRQIPLLMEKYDETIEKNENADHIAERLIEIRCEALEQLKKPTALMAIRLDDINRKISATDEKILQLQAATSEDGEAPKLLSGRGGFDKDGHWILIPAKASTPDSNESSDSKSDPKGDAAEEFANIVKEDLDENATDETDFTKALIVSAYTGRELANQMEDLNTTTALTEYREKLLDDKKIIEDSFKQAQEAFIKVLSENVQKLLSVKIFFDHATPKDGKLPKKAGLIVANCSAAKLIDDKVKDKFEATMRHLGLNVGDRTRVWFAILPHVLGENTSGDAKKNLKLKMKLSDYKKSKDSKKVSTDGTDFSAAKSILKIMEECKILTVFNFAPDDKTTFSALNVDTINDLQNKLDSLNYEHAVYALPNFTIMREGKVSLNKGDKNSVKIDVPAMYIDAAYVAAGLLIAAQNENYWLEKKERLISGNVCSRVDFEWDRITPLLLTKFNRERSIAWNADLVKALTKNRFGFAFDGDRLCDYRTNTFIDNTYILNARTLKRTEGEYQPIFRTLVKDFVHTYLIPFGAGGSQLNERQLREFEKIIAAWKTQIGKYKNDAPINLLLNEGDDIKIMREYEEKEGKTKLIACKLKFDLKGDSDLVEVEIAAD